ncbi:hypothetical protein DITRI_Ditri08aG0147200 [Diplodiscus trichospermus]
MQSDSDRDSEGQKRIGERPIPSNFWRMRAFRDWRASLFTIFVNNLSCRLSKGALWEAFNAYGRVRDVYIHYSAKGDRGKKTTFAFVRYKFKSEMFKAIEVGNNRRIDG